MHPHLALRIQSIYPCPTPPMWRSPGENTSICGAKLWPARYHFGQAAVCLFQDLNRGPHLQLALIDDDDVVCIFDCGQGVGNNDSSPIPHQLIHGVYHILLL